MRRTIIDLQPVKANSAVGRHTSTVVSRSDGRVIERGTHKVSGSNIPISFERDSITGNYKCGLEELVSNPWHKDNNPNWGELPSTWLSEKDFLLEQEDITLQTYLEILDGKPKGTYTSVPGTFLMTDLYVNKGLFEKQKETELDRFTFYVSATTGATLDSKNGQRDRLAILAIQNHSLVAKDAQSVNPDIHHFYIGKAEEKTEQNKTSRRSLTAGFSALENLENDKSTFERYQVSVILGLVEDAELSPSNVSNLLSDYVWESKHRSKTSQIVRAGNIVRTFNLLENDNLAFQIEYLVKMAFNTKVLRQQGGKVYWSSQRDKENLYNLGSNLKGIKKSFLNDLETYDPEIDTDNMYGLLIEELKIKGVNIE